PRYRGARDRSKTQCIIRVYENALGWTLKRHGRNGILPIYGNRLPLVVEADDRIGGSDVHESKALVGILHHHAGGAISRQTDGKRRQHVVQCVHDVDHRHSSARRHRRQRIAHEYSETKPAVGRGGGGIRGVSAGDGPHTHGGDHKNGYDGFLQPALCKIMKDISLDAKNGIITEEFFRAGAVAVVSPTSLSS